MTTRSCARTGLSICHDPDGLWHAGHRGTALEVTDSDRETGWPSAGSRLTDEAPRAADSTADRRRDETDAHRASGCGCRSMVAGLLAPDDRRREPGAHAARMHCPVPSAHAPGWAAGARVRSVGEPRSRFGQEPVRSRDAVGRGTRRCFRRPERAGAWMVGDPGHPSSEGGWAQVEWIGPARTRGRPRRRWCGRACARCP